MKKLHKIEDISTNSITCARILIQCFFRDMRVISELYLNLKKYIYIYISYIA